MYYTNINNETVQHFHDLKVPNFTIKLSDLLTSGLFKVEEIVSNSIYRVYPLFYTNEIFSSNSNDKIMDTKCIILQKQDTETFITFKSDDSKIQDYNNYTSYYEVGDSLSTNQFNTIINLLRNNTIHEDSININEAVTGNYGNYLFHIDEDATILDKGVLITNELLSSTLQVKLNNPVFHYATYTLKLTIVHYSDVNILDDVNDDFIIEDILEVELNQNAWVDIPLTGINPGSIILLNATVEVTHDKPVIPDRIQYINVNSNSSCVQTGDTVDIVGTGYDNGGVPVSSGHTIYFFERLVPTIVLSGTESIIQTNDTMDITAKVTDEDGSIAKNTTVYFYIKEED